MSRPAADTAGPSVEFAPAGDAAVLVTLGAVIDRALNARVRALAEKLQEGRGSEPDSSAAGARWSATAAGPFPWLVEAVPAYASVLVRYDPDRIEYDDLIRLLTSLVDRVDAGTLRPSRRVDVPVRYGGPSGPDLGFIAAASGLTEEEVVALHSGTVYVVYMLGFTPGFCYLGDLPAPLAVPRRKTPRLGLPAGAVAIGGGQTGVYSLDNSPGGWHWIGRTDAPLWDPEREPPFLLRAGDEVRFVPV